MKLPNKHDRSQRKDQKHCQGDPAFRGGLESDTVTPDLGRLCQALAEAIEPTFVGHWLEQPNEILNGVKPVEAIERGQLDLVWQVVEGLRSGSQL